MTKNNYRLRTNDDKVNSVSLKFISNNMNGNTKVGKKH